VPASGLEAGALLSSGARLAAPAGPTPLGVVRTRGIHPGDPVLVNRHGRFFYARVRGPGPTGGLDLDPPDERAGSHSATARELVDHWSHARGAPADGAVAGRSSLDDLMP
jgi:hypothetical protein